MPLDIYPAAIHGLGFTVTKSPEFKTAIQPSSNAYENRLPQTRNPIWHFILVYNYVYDRYRSPNNTYPYTPYSDLSTLIGFYLAHGGTAISFLFDDPKDRTAAGVLAGAWKPNHDYLRNQVVIDPKGHAQLATTPGTSGGTQPSVWNSIGGTTNDGSTLVWTDQGLFPDGFPNAPIALQILDDGFGSFYSPVQRILGGTLYEDITDLNGALSIWADGVLQVEGTDYDLLGPGLILNEVVYTGLYLKWAVQPNPLITAKFSFYFRVTFETDSQDVEHFMDELWSVGGDSGQSGSGTLKLISARPPSPTQPGPALPPPAPSVVSGNIVIWTAFVNSSGAPADAHVGILGQFDVVHTENPYGLRSDSTPLTAGDMAIINTTGQIIVGCYLSNNIGASVTGAPSSLLVYDCYIDAVYSDTSTARIRPGSTRMEIQGEDGFGAISDAGSAIDSDTTPPATFATLLRVDWDPLDFYNMFQMVFAF